MGVSMKCLSLNVSVQPYGLRNGVVQVLGQLIRLAFEGEAGESNLKARDSLIVVLVDRFRDVQAYTRSKVCQVWAELAEYSDIALLLL